MSKSADFPQLAEVAVARHGGNYSAAAMGPLDTWDRYAVNHPLLPNPVTGKVFLKAVLDLSSMEISFGVLPAGRSMSFLHKHHTNEEVYLFVRGRGQMQVDGEAFDVEEGTAVRVAPDGVRAWRASADADLHYVVIQAKAGSLTRWTGTDGIGVNEPVVWPE